MISKFHLILLAGFSAGCAAAANDWEVHSWDTGMRLNAVDFIEFEPDGERHIIAGGSSGVWLGTPGESEARQILDTRDGRIMHGVAADANGDGLQDFFIGRFAAPWVDYRRALAAGEEADEPKGPDFSLAWLENPGSLDGEWVLHLMDDQLNQTHGTFATDFDGDGQMDFFANTVGRSDWDRSILWYPSPLTSEVNGQRKIVTKGNAGGRPHYFAALDMDGDGQQEILMTDNGSLRAWSYDAETEEWSREGLARKRGLTNLAIGDFNGDGQEDIVYSCGHGTGIFALAAPEFEESTEWIVDPAITDVHALAAGDFNGDGLDDVAGISFSENIVVWYENQGEGTFTRHQIDVGGSQQAYDLRAADIDDDGRLDLIAAGRNTRNILWLRNVGSQPE